MAAAGLFLLAALVPTAPLAGADSNVSYPGMPFALADAAAVFDGDSRIYIFGGRTTGGVLSDTILRYNPATQSFTTLPTKLPFALADSSAVWLQGNAYLFGGTTPTGGTAAILRFSPTTGVVTVMGSTLGPATRGIGAASDGTNAYLFGGYKPDTSEYLGSIRAYTAFDNLVTLSTTLPTPAAGIGVGHDGSAFYLFGGTSASGELKTITKYEPSSGSITIRRSDLVGQWCCPVGPGPVPLAWDGYAFVVIRPDTAGTAIRAIQRYNPQTNNLYLSPLELVGQWCCRIGPFPPGPLPASGELLFFGGKSSTGATYSSAVNGLKLSPSAPLGVAASPTGVGQIAVSFGDPPSGSYSAPISAFRITFTPLSCACDNFDRYVTSSGIYTEHGLPNGATYSITVAALNAHGTGVGSTPVTATTWDKPAAPTNAQAQGSTSGRVAVTWTQPPVVGTPLTKHTVHIYRGFLYSGAVEVSGAASSFTDFGCNAGSTCKYYVTASNAVGESGFSNRAAMAGTRTLASNSVPTVYTPYLPAPVGSTVGMVLP